MADGGSDDEVIHLASFNIHRSHGSRCRRRELITISDDSDEEPVALIPSSPVYVPDDADDDDDDDDVSILEANTPTRRHVIRPAAKWSGATSSSSYKSSAASNYPSSSSFSSSSSSSTSSSSTFLSSFPSSSTSSTSSSTSSSSLASHSPIASTSKDTTHSVAQPTIRPATALQSGTSGHPQPGPSTALSQPTPSTDSFDTNKINHHINISTQTSIKTLTKVVANSPSSENVQPSTSRTSQQSDKEPQASTSSASCQTYAPVSKVSCAATATHAKAGPSGDTQKDSSQASTSSVSVEPQPGTSKQVQPIQTIQLNPVQTVKLLVLPQQPNIQASSLITQPQVFHTRGNLIQIEPQTLAQTPAQAPVQAPQIIQVTAPPVLIAAAPERLGPPLAGHRIVVGSLASNPPNSVPRLNAPAPTVTVASVAHNRSGQQQLPGPNQDRAVPGHGAVAVPPAREDPPRIEDAQPGPSAPRERAEQRPEVRDIITKVLDLFPDVQEAYVAELIQKKNVKDLNVICNLLLENPQYPQREIAAATSILLEPGDTQSETSEDLFDYIKLTTVTHEAVMQATDLLMADFRMLSCQDIKWALNGLKGHYAITRKALWEALKKWQETSDPSGKRRRSRTSTERCFIDFHFEHGSVKLEKRMYFLENDRRYCRMYSNLEPTVQKELTFYQQKAKEWAEHEDFLLALQVNEDEYKKDGQLIQCGCCYGDFAFEKMTQCSDGHLFCQECLVNYAQEAVFGSGKSQLSCMSANCQCLFPVCELEKVLPENILLKYHERQAEEAVAATCADELVRCPFCNFPALLDKGISRFSCPNPGCRKESCRKCHVQWKEHIGKTCEQVLEQDEIRMRVLFEERMTAARVRKCVKCGMGLVKSEGCNRMSCRCGSFMCYLCREPIAGYNHFCQHPRSPGAACHHCRKCSLWTDPTQDDERIIQEIQKEGEAELNKKSADNSGKRVGPPPEASSSESKRPRVGPPPEPQPFPPNPPLGDALQDVLNRPPRGHYVNAPRARNHMQVVLPRAPPAPYVFPLPPLPPLNNNNHHQHHNPHLHQPLHQHNWDMMPMHYGPPPHYYRR